MLAVSAYTGIDFASEALKENADHYYENTSFRDIEITSSMLLSEDDIEFLGDLEEVADVEGALFASGNIKSKKGMDSVYVTSITERINVPELLEGSMPQGNFECLMEKELMESQGYHIGDYIKVEDSEGGKPKYLDANNFRITGCVHVADHYARSDYVPEKSYILVNDEAFDLESLEGCVMKAYIRASDKEGLQYVRKDYEEKMSALRSKISDLGVERAAIRDKNVRDKAQKEIDEKSKELKDAKKKLNDAKQQLKTSKQKLKDGKQKLKEGKQKLKDAKAEIKKGGQELASGKARLEEAEEELRVNKEKLDGVKAELDAAWAKLEEGKGELDASKAKLDGAYEELRDAFEKAEAVKDEFRDEMKTAVREIFGKKVERSIPWAASRSGDDITDKNLNIGTFNITDDLSFDLSGSLDNIVEQIAYDLVPDASEEEINELINWLNESKAYRQFAKEQDKKSAQMKEWNKGRKEYLAGLEKYEEGESEYNEKLDEYNDGYAQYEEGLEKYNWGESEYQEKLAEYNEGMAKLEQAKEDYKNGKAEYKDKKAQYKAGVKKYKAGKRQYKDGKQKYKENREKLEDAKQELADLPPASWLVLDATGNGGYIHARDAADNLGKLSMTFALLFILIGALVIYATVGKIVEENRRLIGTQKALGFFSREILVKYICFGSSATALGMIFGAFTATFVIQNIAVSVHARFYVSDHIPLAFIPLVYAIVFVSGIILSALAVWVAAKRMLRQSARELMQEKMPEVKKKKAAKSKASGSLYSRLIVRNLKTDLGRVIITIVSIAGCCILLVIGFTMRENVNAAVTRQFDEIQVYDGKIVFDTESNDGIKESIEKILNKEGMSYLAVYDEQHLFNYGNEFDQATFVVTDDSRLSEFVRLRDAYDSQPITLPESGIIITRRAAESKNLSIGDVIAIYDNDMQKYEAKISGICDFYLGQTFFASGKAYKEIFGEDAADNAFYVNGISDFDALLGKVSALKGFEQLVNMKETRKFFDNFIEALSMVTVVMIVVAGIMACFVLLNLINMHIRQKKRELTIMRINGFTVREVIGYVARESVITTVAGTLVGLAVGSALACAIIRMLEQARAGFVTVPNVKAMIISALITFVFAVIINAIALKKVKDLKLTDIE